MRCEPGGDDVVLYYYEAYDLASHLHRGSIEAISRDDVESQLWRSSLVVTRIGLKKAGFLPRLLDVKVMERVRPMDVAFLFRQMATGVRVGLPLVGALEMQSEQMPTGLFRTVLTEVVKRLRGGSTVWEALGYYPRIFPAVYVEIIRAGEASGDLESALRRCARYIEREQTLLRKVAQGFVYPGFILAMALGVVGVLVTVVLPAMRRMFAAFAAQLPAPTRLLLFLVGYVTAYGLWVASGIALLAALVYGYLRTPTGRLQRDMLLFRLPLLGKLNRELIVARFAQILGTLLSSAVPMGEIMDIMERTAGNRYFISRVAGVRDRILAGEGLSGPLGETGVFPQLVLQIVRVGEESGQLSKTLDEVVAYYEEEVDATLKSLLTLIEPSLILMVGALVGFVAVSVIMPMYSIMNSIH